MHRGGRKLIRAVIYFQVRITFKMWALLLSICSIILVTLTASTMPALDIVDHSPYHPSPAAPLANASNLVLIDNYDSFTWNVYQYLVLEGASVTVHRNDKITLEELISQKPTQLVISPGPGHPQTDSGISRDAIKYFAGKIPVLGVCMGEYATSCSFAR